MACCDLREELNCSVCLNVYTDPVMLICGHNFCRTCILSVLGTQTESAFYTCPECRVEFLEWPDLHRNRKLCNIVEQFLSAHSELSESAIVCTYCIHSPVPALKSCLMCEASLCDTHLKIHSKLEDHILTDPTTCFKNIKCSTHKKVLEYYCCEDSTCVCAHCCLAGDHRGHTVELITEAFEKKQEKLRLVLHKLKKEKKVYNERLQNLQLQTHKVLQKAAEATEEVSVLIRDIREKLKMIESDILREISEQENELSCNILDKIEQLEIKKAELTRHISYMKVLSTTSDPFTILQIEKSLPADSCDAWESDYKDIPSTVYLDKELILDSLQTNLDRFVAYVQTKRMFLVAPSGGPSQPGTLGKLGRHLATPCRRNTHSHAVVRSHALIRSRTRSYIRSVRTHTRL